MQLVFECWSSIYCYLNNNLISFAGGEHSHSHDHEADHSHHAHAENGHSHSHSLKDLSVGLSVLGKD